MHWLWLGRNLVSRLSIIFVSREVSWSTLGCTWWRAIKQPDLHRSCSERPIHGRGQRSPALTVKCGNDDSVWIKTCEDLDPARRLPCLVQRFGTQRSGDPGRLSPPLRLLGFGLVLRVCFPPLPGHVPRTLRLLSTLCSTRSPPPVLYHSRRLSPPAPCLHAVPTPITTTAHPRARPLSPHLL